MLTKRDLNRFHDPIDDIPINSADSPPSRRRVRKARDRNGESRPSFEKKNLSRHKYLVSPSNSQIDTTRIFFCQWGGNDPQGAMVEAVLRAGLCYTNGQRPILPHGYDLAGTERIKSFLITFPSKNAPRKCWSIMQTPESR